MKVKLDIDDKQYELKDEKLFKKLDYTAHIGQDEVHKSKARWRVLACGRRWGKTICASKEIMKAAMIPNQYLWIVVPTYPLTEKCFREVYKHFTFNMPHWVEKKSEHNMRIKLNNGTIIEGKSADNPDGLLGEGLNGLVIDEAARIKKVVWDEYLRPTLADKEGWGLFISTPKGMNWFHEIFTRGQDKLEKETESWNFHTCDNPCISKKEIEEARKSLPERAFKQEWLGVFIEDVGGVFRNVRECVKGELENPIKGHKYIMGVDLAKHQDFTVIVIFDLVSRHLVYYDRFQHLDWGIQKQRIIKANRAYNRCRIILDSAGVGDPILDDLRSNGLSVHGFNKWVSEKGLLVNDLAFAIEDGIISYPDIPELINELNIYAYQVTSSGHTRYNAPEGYHDDIVMAMCLAYLGMKKGYGLRDVTAVAGA